MLFLERALTGKKGEVGEEKCRRVFALNCFVEDSLLGKMVKAAAMG